MKFKLRKILIPTLSLAACSVAILSFNKGATSASASVTERTLISDSFNDTDFSGKANFNVWGASDISNPKIHQTTDGYTYLSQSGSQKGIEFYTFCTRDKLEGITSIQFDFSFGEELTSTSDKKWFSPYITDTPEIALNSEDHNGLAYSGFTRITPGDVNNASGNAILDGDVDKNFNFEVNLGTRERKTWFTVKYEILSSTTATMNVCLQGDEFDPANEVSVEYNKNGVDLQNGYFSIGASNSPEELRIDNIHIRRDGFDIDEDFDELDLENEDSLFYIVNNPSKDLKDSTYKVVDNCVLTFNDSAADDYLYTISQTKDLTNGINDIDVLSVEFNVKLTQKKDKIAIVFNYDPSTNNFRKNTVVYEMSKNTGVLKEYDENGVQLTNDEENTNSFTAMANESSFVITFNKNKGVHVYENDVCVQYNGYDVDFANVTRFLGNIGFVTLDRASSNGEFYIDSFVAKANSYYKPITKSVTHTFNQAYWGNEETGLYDFYFKPNPSNAMYCEDGKLVWSGASDFNFFGSYHQYDSFILDFKLCSIYGDSSVTSSNTITSYDKWIGLDISRAKVDRSDYGSYLTPMVYITPAVGAKNTKFGVYTTDYAGDAYTGMRMTNFKNIPASLFTDITYSSSDKKANIKAEDAVCFRYVSDGNTLTLYLKKASELNYVKYVSISNIVIEGYFALCCTGYTFIEIDDFSMANTSEIYECADTYTPEPNTEVTTVTIYDNQNNDINLDEEIRLNTNSGCGGSIIATTSVVCIISAVLLILVIKKKREDKSCER